MPRACDDANSVRQIARRHAAAVRAWLALRDESCGGDRELTNKIVGLWADSQSVVDLGRSPRADAKGVG